MQTGGRPSLDMRWRTCNSPNQYGSIRYNITVAEGNRTIGTNFVAGTCLVLQWRPFASADTSKSFVGAVYWNDNYV